MYPELSSGNQGPDRRNYSLWKTEANDGYLVFCGVENLALSGREAHAYIG
jgi:hypothetical protein